MPFSSCQSTSLRCRQVEATRASHTQRIGLRLPTRPLAESHTCLPDNRQRVTVPCTDVGKLHRHDVQTRGGQPQRPSGTRRDGGRSHARRAEPARCRWSCASGGTHGFGAMAARAHSQCAVPVLNRFIHNGPFLKRRSPLDKHIHLDALIVRIRAVAPDPGEGRTQGRGHYDQEAIDNKNNALRFELERFIPMIVSRGVLLEQSTRLCAALQPTTAT
ncbi:hypothetical protein B0H14DRAFT_665995 [Mycena olivaceomarginata]|nr:hypothetical protein B0H14DRAFT_665995 [Mycena olivaceomarginata]